MNAPFADDALWQVFYVSRSTAAPDGLDTLLQNARRNNAERRLTGALVFTGGHFAQVLEGPVSVLQRTMEDIERDDRHERLRRLIDAPLPRRRFEQWAMALIDAPGADDVLHDVLQADQVPPDRVARLAERLFAGPPR